MTAILIAVAGHETTANMLGAGTHYAAQPQPRWQPLVDRVDPADPAVVTELLRLHGPVQVHGAHRHHDHTIAGARHPLR